MLQSERFEKILTMLNNKRFITLKEFEESLHISKSTLRRDLMELEEAGKLTRMRGGASLTFLEQNGSGTSVEPHYNTRSETNIEEKQRIAQAALQFIRPGDTILLDAGTTVFELAKALKNTSGLMIATSDLLTAVELTQNTDNDLIVVGGQVRKNYYSMIGYFSDRVISEMHADTAFISADAVDLNHGLMTFNLSEVNGKRGMINSARESILLCDHTKFDAVAFVSICPIVEIDKIITGKELDESKQEILHEYGIDIILI
ncbi:DeoR/GlpR family DNA-binding transcription regulator [Lacrimispora sp. NSJ-141]|uniref:DeoR/GlpR family DNA-binding transcription regulator n=1 Tax=Lientehia hominis TaxID=2897778 RepID=A0AAP2WAR6_9FIRM|nr:DeoR/GlpR family DNA-binding transcription regulator [Lientehia hominis]MCD2493734.1 DeoR/GlpR family DNA-binding transcription regulator [Lientehia hominis]